LPGRSQTEGAPSAAFKKKEEVDTATKKKEEVDTATAGEKATHRTFFVFTPSLNAATRALLPLLVQASGTLLANLKRKGKWCEQVGCFCWCWQWWLWCC
jgi:hypothetical protein